MIGIIVFLTIIIISYVVVSDKNNKRKEEKGICKTTGSTCTSPTGCTCGDEFDQHEH